MKKGFRILLDIISLVCSIATLVFLVKMFYFDNDNSDIYDDIDKLSS